MNEKIIREALTAVATHEKAGRPITGDTQAIEDCMSMGLIKMNGSGRYSLTNEGKEWMVKNSNRWSD